MVSEKFQSARFCFVDSHRDTPILELLRRVSNDSFIARRINLVYVVVLELVGG